jgi:hypothetical protein
MQYSFVKMYADQPLLFVINKNESLNGSLECERMER